jgi:hypothetical protein
MILKHGRKSIKISGVSVILLNLFSQKLTMKQALQTVLFLLFFMSCNSDHDEYPGAIVGNAFLARHSYYSNDSVFADNSDIKVTLLCKDGDWIKTSTDAAGNYKFADVADGEYMLKFEKSGFTYFELFNIQHNGLDTLNLSKNRVSDASVKLYQYKTYNWKIVEDLWIGYYLGSLNRPPYECGKNFQIIAEVKADNGVGCVAFIDTSKHVDCFHYKLAVPVSSFGRLGVENPIMPVNLSLFDLKIFRPGALVYVRYYPCVTSAYDFDPWLGIDKYFGLIPGMDKTMWIKLPRDTMYFWGQPGCN